MTTHRGGLGGAEVDGFRLRISGRCGVGAAESIASEIDCAGRGRRRSPLRGRRKPEPRSQTRSSANAGSGDGVCRSLRAAKQGFAVPSASGSFAKRSGPGCWNRFEAPRESPRPWRPPEDRHRSVRAARGTSRNQTVQKHGRNRGREHLLNRDSRWRSGSIGVFQTETVAKRMGTNLRPQCFAVESGRIRMLCPSRGLIANHGRVEMFPFSSRPIFLFRDRPFPGRSDETPIGSPTTGCPKSCLKQAERAFLSAGRPLSGGASLYSAVDWISNPVAEISFGGIDRAAVTVRA